MIGGWGVLIDYLPPKYLGGIVVTFEGGNL